MLAVAAVAVQPAVADRRVGEHGDEHRCQPHACAKLRHRVLLVEEVDVGLHRGGLLHHALAKRANGRHIRSHDAIALLRHPLDLIQSADRLHAQPEKSDAERLADL